MSSTTISTGITSGMSENDESYAALKLIEILENIFEFCKFEDLKSCRLVSKTWMNAAKISWHLRAFVQIQEIGLKNDKRMSEYLQFARENVNNNLVNFNIKLCYPICDLYTIIQFFELCGGQIKCLKLNFNKFRNTISVRDIVFKYCPNMKSLLLHRCESGKTLNQMLRIPSGFARKFDTRENKNVRRIKISPLSIFYGKISWMELFTNYPKLQGLQLVGFVIGKHIQEIFEAINIIRKQDSRKLRLKHVHTLVCKRFATNFVESIPSSLLQFLQSPTVHIENLSMTISRVEDISNTRIIMKTHASTLNTLELDTTDAHFMNYFDYRISAELHIQSLLCKNLVTLKLSQDLLKFLTFLQSMPSLRKLVIYKEDQTCWSNCPKISEITLGSDRDDFRLGSLANLELHFEESAEGVLKLIKWFPNVERLKMPLNNETFGLVCQGWPNLTSLNINGSKVDECGITGLDGGQVIRINNSKGNYCKRPDTVPRVNITDLKQLRSFHMSMDTGCRSPYSFLSFCSVVHGFRLSTCPENIFVKNYNVNTELWSQEKESEDFYRTLV